MNWYKKAKLINKNPTNMEPLNLSCMYCKRFATHPNNEKAYDNQYEWKTLKEMNPEENQLSQENYKNTNVSHGICPHCKNIINSLQKNGINPFRLKPREIAEMSLRKRID